MTEKTINILKSLKLGEKYPAHKPLGKQEIEEQGVLSTLYNLGILKRVKYSYSVNNLKYLSKFIKLQDFEKLSEYIESESKTGSIIENNFNGDFNGNFIQDSLLDKSPIKNKVNAEPNNKPEQKSFVKKIFSSGWTLAFVMLVIEEITLGKIWSSICSWFE